MANGFAAEMLAHWRGSFAVRKVDTFLVSRLKIYSLGGRLFDTMMGRWRETGLPMLRTVLRTFVIGLGILATGYGCASLSAQLPGSGVPSSDSQHRNLLKRYCITCHNERLGTADLLLDQADVENVGVDAAIWEKVVRKLRTGAMPPSGLPRPDQDATGALIGYLEEELDRAAAAAPDPGRPVIHRLNRAEFSNAVRDLLAVEIDELSLLPADDSGHGFDNVGETLSVSPLLAEAYMSAARMISSKAVGDSDISPFTAEHEISRRLVQDGRMSEDLPFGSRGGAAIRHHFPMDGEYVLKVRLQRNNDNYIRGLGEPHELDIRLDGARLKSFTIGGEHKGRSGPVYSFVNKDYLGDPEQENYEFSADEGLEVRFQSQAGTRLIGVSFLQLLSEDEGENLPRQSFDELLSFKGGEPAVDKIWISGPYNASGLGDTASRRKIFICTPASPVEEEDCARRILSTLARRAYRRPVNEADVQTLLRFYAVGRTQGGFEAGVRTGIQGLLVSPGFLFRMEQEPAGVAPGTPYPVSQLDLASRLSFFLWSSIPDDELLDLAERGRLRDPGVLEAQVARMLSDPRSSALVRNFTEQWLGLRKLDAVSPDPKVFPEFDENLREALQQETLLFADSIVREDRSLLDFLGADYTFVNERLARHYGIRNVFGSGFRRVTLADDARKGLLGHAGILTVTSYANRTSPTLRGKWVLDNILGTPPPPPPPNVPALKEANEENGKTLTMRERMDQHRVNPSCAVCHERMDPLGFAMENFDAIGRWRAEEEIDPSGVLPDGTSFQGPAELNAILLGRQDQFFQTVVEKLLMYALGRGIDYRDQPVVRSIIGKSAASDHRWSSVVLEIVNSMPFQMRRSREP